MISHCAVCRKPITVIALAQRPHELWAVCDTCDHPQCDCPDCA